MSIVCARKCDAQLGSRTMPRVFPIPRNFERMKYVTFCKLLLRRYRDRGDRTAGSHGLLSLQLLPFQLRKSFQRFQPVGSQGGPDQSRFATCRDVSEAGHEPVEIMREVRRPFDELSSDTPPAERFRTTLPTLAFSPSFHASYAETVLPVRDGLPKLKDFPQELGGSGEMIAE